MGWDLPDGHFNAMHFTGALLINSNVGRRGATDDEQARKECEG